MRTRSFQLMPISLMLQSQIHVEFTISVCSLIHLHNVSYICCAFIIHKHETHTHTTCDWLSLKAPKYWCRTRIVISFALISPGHIRHHIPEIISALYCSCVVAVARVLRNLRATRWPSTLIRLVHLSHETRTIQ